MIEGEIREFAPGVYGPTKYKFEPRRVIWPLTTEQDASKEYLPLRYCYAIVIEESGTVVVEVGDMFADASEELQSEIISGVKNVLDLMSEYFDEKGVDTDRIYLTKVGSARTSGFEAKDLRQN